MHAKLTKAIKSIFVLLFILVYCSLTPIPSHSAYNDPVYVDPTNEDNDTVQDGSFEHPYDSWTDITFVKNTKYLQKCGTTAAADYESDIIIEQIDSDSGTPLVLGAYYDDNGTMVEGLESGGEKPIITGRGPLRILSDSDWTNSSDWCEYDTNKWVLKYPRAVNRLFLKTEDNETAFEAMTACRPNERRRDDCDQPTYLGVDNETFSTALWWHGVFNWDNSTCSDAIEGKPVLALYSPGNPAGYYEKIESNRPYDSWVGKININRSKNVTIQNLDIRASYIAIKILGSSYCTIKDSDIGRDSVSGVKISYHDNGTKIFESHDNLVENCVIDSGMSFKYKDYGLIGTLDGIAIRGYENTIRNNQFDDWGHCSIDVLMLLDNSTNGSNNNMIYNNYCSAEHISYGRGMGIAGIEGKCSYNHIFSNIIENTKTRNQMGGDHNYYYYNLIDTIPKSTVRRNHDISQGIGLEGYVFKGVHSLTSKYNYYVNNTVVNCASAGINIISYSEDVVGNVFSNNIISNCGIDAERTSQSVGISIGDIDNNEAILDNTFENNIIDSNISTPIYYKDNGTISVAAFNAMNGNDTDTISGNIHASPDFVASDDYNSCGFSSAGSVGK
jgi:hypothetical protein